MKTCRMLIVDSYPDAAESLQILLQKQGHETLIANNCTEALYSNFEPDIILLDIIIPGCDGHDLGQRLQDKYECPVIVLTGYNAPVAIHQSRSLGWTHLLKPTDLQTLMSHIQRVVDSHSCPNLCRSSKRSRAMSFSSVANEQVILQFSSFLCCDLRKS
jgi:DNA-binding NtrC family response regulator